MNMRASLLRSLATLTFLAAWASTPAPAQWFVGLDLGADRFWGGSADTTGTETSFHPYRPTVLGLGVEHRSNKVGLGLRLHYTDAALALEGEDGAALGNGIFDVYAAALELGYRLATLGEDNELIMRGGPLVERWDISGVEDQTRLGFQGSISLRVPLGGRFAGSLLAGGAVISSPFQAEDLPLEFETRTLWRRGVSGRLECRL